MRILKTEVIDTTTVGGRIKYLRVKAKMSQDELAEALHFENRASISSYETNRRGVSGSLAVYMADILGSTTDYILNGDIYEDPFINEIYYLMSRVRSDAMKKMILQQIKAAVDFEGSLRSGVCN